MNSGLLATKLHRPSAPPKRLHRPHLLQQLQEGLDAGRQITLVSAPAGFGKTTCISEWLDTLEHWPVAWLSLDPADDDPARFFAYLVAALQNVDLNLAQEIDGALRSGQLPPSEVISRSLINDMLELKGRFLLVLDDLQVIQDRFILQVLEALLGNLPQPLYLVVVTREDPPLPLARLRASNQLTEIRARDLRFTSDEAGRFLNEVMGLVLSEADIAVLEEKTEGWVVGLQLAGLSIRGRSNPSDLIASLSGSHRFILSYLTEEVLGQQPGEIQHFLLQTSILDRLNVDLCNAVTGRLDGRAVLEHLFNANLFLVPLDDEGQWYRYHHLFADLLRELRLALHKDETAVLHQRACRWYAQAGMASAAVKHSLAAEDYAAAVELLERHAMGMVMRGYAKTVDAWVQAIPEKWRSSSPRTYLAFAWMHLLRGAYAQALPYLERSQAAFAGPEAKPHLDEEKRSLQAEWLVMHSLLRNMQGKMDEGLALATQALEIAPKEDSRVRSLAYLGLASTHQATGSYESVVDAYQRAIQHGRAAGNLVAEMISTTGLAQMAFEHGKLHLAHEIAAPAAARLEGSGSLPPISTLVFGMLAEVYYQWAQIDEARRHSQRALQLSTLGGYNSGVIGCRLLLSRVSRLEGDLEDAAREIQKAVDLMRVDTPDYVRQEVVAHQARIYLARNRPAAAEMALEGLGFSFRDRFSSPDLPPGRGISYSAGLLYNSGLHVLLSRARAGRSLADLMAAIELAGRLIGRALQSQSLLVALEALLLRAQMHAALGRGEADPSASQADYVRALELAEPEGILGVFVEQGPAVAEALSVMAGQNQVGAAQRGYIEHILEAFSRLQLPSALPAPRTPAGTGPTALIEPLTDRELDVLRLMAEGLKYKEIAERLFISLNTVRSHVKAIYGKLNVNNRTQAIETARQRGIM